MKNLWQHIESLLIEHDYVVIPRLGGYVIQSQSAQVLQDRIIPPLHTVGFNPLMKHNDGLLAVEIAKANHISFREAMQAIASEVRNIQHSLNTEGKTVAGNLGVLLKSETCEIIFEPKTPSEILPSNFCLTEIYSPRTSKSSSKKEQTAFSISLPSSRVYRYAAAAALIFGLFFSAPDLNTGFKTNQADLAGIAFTKNPSLNLLATTADSTVVDTVKTAESVNTIKRFHIIISSWKNLKTASTFRTGIASDYQTAQVLSSPRIHYVSIESFANRDSAIQHMENLRILDSRFQSAWVLCK